MRRTAIWAFLLVLGCSYRGRAGPSETPPKHAPGPGCHRNLTVGPGGGRGFLSSPGFPGPYPAGADCRWLLTSARPGTPITLHIHSLDLEEDTDCRLDYLQVHQGRDGLAPPLGPFCGQMRNRTLRTNSSSVLLLFHSDPVNERAGFSLEYSAGAGSGCDQSLTGGAGAFHSPGYPGKYPDGADCWVTVTAEAPGRRVALHFDPLDLEFDEGCALDFVRVFDGPTGNSPLLSQACQGARRFESTGSALLVHFHSDETYSRGGFRARYETLDENLPPPSGGCLWQRGDGGGSVASPNYPGKYPELSDCALWLVAPAGHRVSLAFDAFSLEPAERCAADYLQVREGPASDPKILGTFCDSENEPGNLTSTGNKVQIIFHSDDAFQFSGFKLRYWFWTNTTAPKSSPPDQEGAVALVVVPENATLAAGSSHRLDCRTNRTGVGIEWRKGELPLSGSEPVPGLRLLANGSLWIESMERRLSGVYTCLAAAEGAEGARAYVVMREDDDDPGTDCGIVFRKRPRPSTWTEGEPLQLECVASGEGGRPRVSWEKDGAPLAAAPPRLLLLGGGALLHVDRAEPADAGLYACRARAAACQRRASALVQVARRIDVQKVCGRPRLAQPVADIPQVDHGKIIGGSDAKRGAHPWQVMLWEPSLGAFCGGTLLNERWIATAAHCFVNYRNLRWERVVVKLGKHDREQREPGEVSTGIADASAVVVHPAYGRRTFDNDLALVRLRDHVAPSAGVLPACLGGPEPAPGTLGTVVGWGKLKEGGPSPRFLQEIRLPVAERAACVASTNYTVSRNMFCAGYAQEVLGDACHGDSGGPFLVSRNARWHLVGIVSWGEGCGSPGKYGFYTRVAEYLPWIRGIIRS